MGGRGGQWGSGVFSEDLVGQRRTSVEFNPPICDEFMLTPCVLPHRTQWQFRV